MEQTRALNALQPYLALSKSATSPRAAVDVIAQATSAPHTYVFAELLSTPSIQNLKTCQEKQYKSHYRLLEIFAWGTYADYKTNAASLPNLNPQQTRKLLLLTLLTLASTVESSDALTYAHLTAELGLSSTRELEKLVTDAVYNSLLSATMDSKSQILVVSSVAPLRDLAPGSLGDMIKELDAWSTRCETVLAELEAEVDKVRKDAAERRRVDAVRDAQIIAAESKSAATTAPTSSGKLLGNKGHGSALGNENRAASDNQDFEDEDLMDVDDSAPLAGKTGKKTGKLLSFGRRNK